MRPLALLPLVVVLGCQEFSVDRQGNVEDTLGVALDLEPAEHTFTQVCTEEETVISLVNAGDAPVVVEGISYDADISSLRMSHRNPVPGPFEIAVGERAFVTVTNRPSRPVANRGILSVESNDPRGVVEAIQQVDAAPERREDRFDPRERVVDILIAVDTTGSMDSLHRSGIITDGLTALVDELDRIGADWKVGVVWGSDPCVRGPVLAGASDAVASIAAAFPGAKSPDNNQMFYMVDAALAETTTGGCNTNFRREDASLAVVLLSNSIPETDREWSEVGDGWTNYVDDCRDLSVHSLVNVDQFDNVTRDNFYIDAAETTGGVVVNSPGKEPWSTKWGLVGAGMSERTRLLWLSSVPIPESVTVSVGSDEWTEGWEFDEDLSAVRLLRPVPSGQEVSVSYDIDRCLPLECTF